jgi:hypothetical protein
VRSLVNVLTDYTINLLVDLSINCNW